MPIVEWKYIKNMKFILHFHEHFYAVLIVEANRTSDLQLSENGLLTITEGMSCNQEPIPVKVRVVF